MEKISRREFLKLSGVTAAGLVLGACAPTATQSPATQAPATSAPTTRPAVDADWWTVAGADVGNEPDQRAWVAEFQKTDPGSWVKVNATFLPDDGFSEKMTTVLGTGSGVPDVTTFWDANWFPLALDLRDYIARDGVDINMYSKRHFDSRCRFGDEIIGLPIGVGATMYFYNQDMFDKAGLVLPAVGLHHGSVPSGLRQNERHREQDLRRHHAHACLARRVLRFWRPPVQRGRQDGRRLHERR